MGQGAFLNQKMNKMSLFQMISSPPNLPCTPTISLGKRNLVESQQKVLHRVNYILELEEMMSPAKQRINEFMTLNSEGRRIFQYCLRLADDCAPRRAF
jgi:hypothetical protein